MIKTERLLLRPLQQGDALALHQIANEPEIIRWMPDWQSTREEIERLIRYFGVQFHLANRREARVAFAVQLEDEVIGMVGVGNKPEVDDEIEIAYFVSQTHVGRGYATEAAKAVAQWALANLGMEYLMAIVDTDNHPSQRVLERCGFRKVGTRRLVNSGESEEKEFYYYRLYQA